MYIPPAAVRDIEVFPTFFEILYNTRIFLVYNNKLYNPFKYTESNTNPTINVFLNEFQLHYTDLEALYNYDCYNILKDIGISNPYL